MSKFDIEHEDEYSRVPAEAKYSDLVSIREPSNKLEKSIYWSKNAYLPTKRAISRNTSVTNAARRMLNVSMSSLSL